jgi:hypothetical protein
MLNDGSECFAPISILLTRRINMIRYIAEWQMGKKYVTGRTISEFANFIRHVINVKHVKDDVKGRQISTATHVTHVST